MQRDEGNQPEPARSFSLAAMMACGLLMAAIGLTTGLMLAGRQAEGGSGGDAGLVAARFDLQVATSRLGWLETMASPAGLAMLPRPGSELSPHQMFWAPRTSIEQPLEWSGEPLWRFASAEEAERLRRLEELANAPMEASLDALEHQTEDLKSAFEGLSLVGRPTSELAEHPVDLTLGEATEWFEAMEEDAVQQRARYLSEMVAEARADVDRLEELVGDPEGSSVHTLDLRSVELSLQSVVGSDLGELERESLAQALAALLNRVDSSLSAMEDMVTVNVLAYRDPRDLQPPVGPFSRVVWPAVDGRSKAALEPFPAARLQHEAVQSKVRDVLDRLEVTEKEVRVPNRARRLLRSWRAKLIEARYTR